MTETTYLPHDWLDEQIPDPQPHPDAFLWLCSDRGWILRPLDDDDVDDFPAIPVRPGALVVFSQHRWYGASTVTIDAERDADGEPRWQGGDSIPADANCFVINGEYEDLADTLEEAIGNALTNDPGLSGAVEVDAYHWSNGDPWRFDVTDGKGGFTRQEAADVLH